MIALNFLFLAASGKLCAQSEYSKWLFGNNVYIDFQASGPVSLPNSAMTAPEGCSSISDAAGNLLFYTNGVNIWNKNHQLMSGTLAGHISSSQAALVINYPSSSQKYYVFTTGEYGYGNLCYSVIDISLAAGLGSLTALNVPLLDSVAEKLASTLHCNGTDMWIVTHKGNNSDAFYSFLLGTTGISSIPVISKTGSIHSPGMSSGNSVGCMKISPTGKKLGLCKTHTTAGETELFDFDPATGQVSNSLTLQTGFPYAYGCEFSPDGTKFYATGFMHSASAYVVRQWDVGAATNSAIIASAVTIKADSSNTIQGIQLGPDRKIYLSVNVPGLLPKFLSSITNPDAAGSASGYVTVSVPISHGACGRGLPNLTASLMRKKSTLPASFSSSCGVVTFSYTPYNYSPAANYSVNSVAWDFGDPSSASSNTSALAAPQHTYQSNGTYTVTFVARYDCYTDTIRKAIVVGDLPVISVAGSSVMCNGESRTYSASGASTYSWSTGIQGASATITSSATASYTVSGTNSAGCTARKAFTVAVAPCIGIGELSGESFRIFPNPAEHLIRIEAADQKQLSCLLKIFDVTGILKYESQLEFHDGSAAVSTQDLASGVYSLEVSSSGTHVNRKLIIIRR